MEQATQVVADSTTPESAPLALVPQPESVEALLPLWLEWATRSKGLSPNTIKLYRRVIQEAAKDLPDLIHATEEQLQAWVESKGGQPGTFCNRITGLGSFYRFLVKTKRRGDNPTAEMDRPKIAKRLPKPVEDLEQALLLADVGDVRANERGVQPRRVGETRDMIVFLAYTGLRIHEAVKCDWPVPCPEEAFVIGKGNKEELMQIHPKAREAWDRLGGKWPIGARGTQRRFERSDIHPHQCRHWLATTLVRSGVEIGRVSKIMRHNSVQTTMGYAAFQKEQNREALAQLP